MLELDEALLRILSAIKPPVPETIPLGNTTGRFLAEKIVSPINLPPFDNSAMDGYAVRAQDVAKAGPTTPVALQLVSTVAAGAAMSAAVEPGTCVRIFTGSPLPAGADAVAMQEDTRVDTDAPKSICFLDAVKPWENVRLAGEDLKQGAAAAQPGDRLTAGRLGLLAAIGLAEVRVCRQPVVGLLATGNELQEAGPPLQPGKIYESNRQCLAPLAVQAGGVPRIFPLVEDTPAATRAALESALSQCYLVVTTGGVSVGEHDLVKTAFQQLGGEMEFWRVAIKPGKPFGFGRWGEKLWFGLPGNPVSAFVTFLLLVRPAILRWQGATQPGLPVRQGTLAESLNNRGDRRHFIRVRVDNHARVWSAGTQASHILSSLAEANGLVDVPPRTSFPSGVQVNVLSLE